VYNNEKMVGRYYEQFPIDTKNGQSNFTLILLKHVLEFIGRDDSQSPYFLYFAPDSTHGPAYASSKFLGKSVRGTAYGDAVMELDWAVGQILKHVRARQ